MKLGLPIWLGSRAPRGHLLLPRGNGVGCPWRVSSLRWEVSLRDPSAWWGLSEDLPSSGVLCGLWLSLQRNQVHQDIEDCEQAGVWKDNRKAPWFCVRKTGKEDKGLTVLVGGEKQEKKVWEGERREPG